MRRLLILFALASLLLAACRTPLPGVEATVQTSIAPTQTEAPTDTPAPTQTATPTETPEPTDTPTPTSIPTYTLSGVVFFDYNGNGFQDGGEPPIEGVEITVQSIRHSGDQEWTVVTGATGGYRCENIPLGRYNVHIIAPNADDPSRAFRYTTVLQGWTDIPAYDMNGVTVPAQHLPNTESQPIDRALRINMDRNQTLDIGLMQGYLTALFEPSNQEMITIWTGFDLDSRPGIRRNWQGSTAVTDGHDGIDYKGPVGVFVLAAAPGRVTIAGLNPYGQDNCPGVIAVDLWHYIDGDLAFETHYGHLLHVLVNVDEEVLRGQIIGTLGSSGECCSDLLPHVHFGFYIFKPAEGGGLQAQPEDPYRDITDPASLNYWTKDNDPQSTFQYEQ